MVIDREKSYTTNPGVHQVKKIGLLGVSFDTGNLGVSALGWSSVRLIMEKWPHANIDIVGSGCSRSKRLIDIDICQLEVNNWPVRFCADPFTKDHFWKIFLGAILIRIMPFMRSFFAKQQNTLGTLCRADMVADITGGDSFSDIYGIKRFFLSYLIKRLCQSTGKPFIMLPQTYGPFKRPVTRFLARRVLKKASRIYSRDKEGMHTVKKLIGEIDKLSLSRDMAFILQPKSPEYSMVSNGHLMNLLNDNNNSQVIGLNVSGLLYNGGYTGGNEFGIKSDYRNLIDSILKYFVELPNTNILLVPHAVTYGYDTENDLLACRHVLNSLDKNIRDKIYVAEPSDQNTFFDQREIKYIIGKCDFFMGSRMHATIAAISQCVPTVGLAYSKKFSGVYETVGIGDCVVDLRTLASREILDRVKDHYKNRKGIKNRLEYSIPQARQKVLQLFDNL